MIRILDTKCNPTSSIRATCCHDVTNKLAFAVSIKDTTVDYSAERFVNAVSYCVVCLNCLLGYLFRGDILFTKRSEQKWML
jgi:hypothetical protein